MRRVERMVGALFLLSTGSFLVGSGMLDPILHGTDLLALLDMERASVLAALFLELMNAVAVMGIAIMLQPTLRQYHEAFAYGYFASRVLESVLLIVSLLGPLVLLVLSKQYISEGASTSGDSYLQGLANVAVESHYLLFDMAMLVLSFGSILFCYILYQSKLIPQLLSMIGLIGYSCLLAKCALSILGIDVGEILYIPGAIFEIAFPVWLIFKGFNLQKKPLFSN